MLLPDLALRLCQQIPEDAHAPAGQLSHRGIGWVEHALRVAWLDPQGSGEVVGTPPQSGVLLHQPGARLQDRLAVGLLPGGVPAGEPVEDEPWHARIGSLWCARCPRSLKRIRDVLHHDPGAAVCVIDVHVHVGDPEAIRHPLRPEKAVLPGHRFERQRDAHRHARPAPRAPVFHDPVGRRGALAVPSTLTSVRKRSLPPQPT